MASGAAHISLGLLLVQCAIAAIIGAKAVIAAGGAQTLADRCRATTPLAATYGAALTRDMRRGEALLLADTRMFMSRVRENGLLDCDDLAAVVRSAEVALRTTCPPCEARLQHAAPA